MQNEITHSPAMVPVRRLLPVPAAMASLLMSVAVACFAAEEQAFYRFEAGEPSTYRLEVNATNTVLTEAKFFDGTEASARSNNVAIRVDYQLMPILQNEHGDWKMRVVLDQIQQRAEKDGEVTRNDFDRAALHRHQMSASELMRMDASASMTRRLAAEKTTSANDSDTGSNTMSVHSTEDLFDQPILAWIATNGTVLKLEDRTELQQLTAGINLKECLELVFPPLPASSLKEGTSWTREVPVELPAPPISPATSKPLISKLSYEVKKIQQFEGRSCARISVKGRLQVEGLSVPIGQEEFKHLVWLKSLTKIDDQIEGEFLFDLERKNVLSSELNSTYCYSTISGRKLDNYRSHIDADHIIQTKLIGRLVPEPPGSGSLTQQTTTTLTASGN